jgi:3-deoxy-7-phosphoheptulonate synthase
VILRGGKEPNYDAASIDGVSKQLEAAKLPVRIMVDVSHGNSSKKPENQPLVIADIARRIESGERRISGVMVESHLKAGRQDLVPGKTPEYGQSITDGCIDWQSSLNVLETLASAVRARRERAS